MDIYIIFLHNQMSDQSNNTKLGNFSSMICERDNAIRERDELMQQNANLREIAERAITTVALWAGSRTNSAAKLRAELNQLKEGTK